MGHPFFLLIVLVWNFPEVQFRPTGKENVVICNHNVCIAGKIEKGGTCVCCIVCQTMFNRENGSVDCPLSRSDCSDTCIAGYENNPVFNGGNLDICKRSKSTTAIPNIPSDEKSEKVNSGTIAAAVIVPVVIIAIVILAVIYRLRSKNGETPKLETNNLSVGAESSEEEAQIEVKGKEPEENTDVTAVIENQGTANFEENQLVQATPIDCNAANTNQTYQPSVFHGNEGEPEIPTAPYSSITEDTNPGVSSTYTASTARVDDIFRDLNNGLNTPDGIRLTMNLDLTLTPQQN